MKRVQAVRVSVLLCPMRVLVTGANGYIGLRLIPELLESGYEVVAQVRNRKRFPESNFAQWGEKFSLIEADYLKKDSLPDPTQVGAVDAAYYFLHSMGAGENFAEREQSCAKNFISWLQQLGCQQLVYLGGIAPAEGELSEHLRSRVRVAEVLAGGGIPLTVLRASIIVGSGSASFEIIRDLVEKLPLMVTPKWARTRCQPIAIRNVIYYLKAVISDDAKGQSVGQQFDIGGEEVLTYQKMLLGYARVRGLRRRVVPVPFLSPKLSSYWLFFMTATSYALARSLVGSLHIETTCTDQRLRKILPQKLLGYDESIELALSRIAQNRVPSVWYDSLSSGQIDVRHIRNVYVPEHGVVTDERFRKLSVKREVVIDAVWALGGERGWPSMGWAWKLRGLLDKCLGGIGLRRGRRHPSELRVGDALDFWRVVVADREQGRLILVAEMRLPGEAWLEFEVRDDVLWQRATFRPLGLLGRLYWALTYPFHLIVFPQMLRRLSDGWRGPK